MSNLIFGVGVNLKAPNVLACKTVEDVKALDIFNHLPDHEKELAEKRLLVKTGALIEDAEEEVEDEKNEEEED